MELLHPGTAKAIIKLVKRENFCEQTIQLIDYAIPFKAPLKPYQEYYKEITPLTNKALGTVLGSVVGDSFGSITEFAPLSYTRSTVNDFLPSFFDYKHKSTIDGVINHCHVKSGQWSDDTSMGLCIIDSLIEIGQYDWRDLKTRFLSWWYLGYNNTFRFDMDRKHRTSVGLGGIVGKALMEYMLNPEIEFSKASVDQSGNGSLMRNAGIPVYYHNDLDKAISYSINQSYLTHTGIEAAECCAYLTYIVHKALNFDKYLPAKEFLDSCTAEKLNLKSKGVIALTQSKAEDGLFIPDEYNLSRSEDRNWNWKSPSFKYSMFRAKTSPVYIGSYAMDALAMALHCVYHTKSYKDAMIKIVNLGGDADTVGCIAGQIAGAIYGLNGIPKEWVEQISQWDKGSIGSRAIDLLNYPK